MVLLILDICYSLVVVCCCFFFFFLMWQLQYLSYPDIWPKNQVFVLMENVLNFINMQALESMKF